MNQTLENGKKTNFEYNFGPLGPNLGLQFIDLFIYYIFFVGFIFTRFQTLSQAMIVCNFIKMIKTE